MRHLAASLALALAFAPSLSPAQQLPAGTRSVADADQAQAELYRKAQAALEEQKYPEAEKLLSDYLREDPKNAAALYQLGFSLEAQEKDDAAKVAYQHAIEADPNQFESRLTLGLLEARHDHAAEAREQLLKAAALKPADPGAANAMKGRALRALAQLDRTSNPAEARDALVAALKLTPETPDDTLLVAELADGANDAAAAETAYKRLTAQPDPPPEAVTGYAGFLLRHGRADEALPMLEKMHAAAPADQNLARLLAHFYLQKKDAAKAEPLLRQALSATPQDPALLDDLGSALVLQQKFADAQDVFTQAVSIPVERWPAPGDLGEAAGHLAFAASQNHNPKLVLQALALRAKLLPISPSALFLEATAFDSLHQTEQATISYRKFLTVAAGKYPEQEWQARHRIAALEHK